MKIISFKKDEQVDVSVLENAAGFSLAPEYISFLEQYNGGLIDEDIPVSLSIQGLDVFVDLSILFGLNTEIRDFDIIYMNSVYEDDEPENALIIGGTADGGLIFVINEDNRQPVCYWDRNLTFAFSSQDANAYIISPSLSEFFRNLGDFEVSEHTIQLKKGENTMIEKIDYLPLGSVVYLKGATGKLFITSRAILVKHGEEEVFFDYAGAAYPEGLISDQVVYFNHDGIVKVVFEGYKSEEDEIVVENIHRYIDEHPELVKGDAKTW